MFDKQVSVIITTNETHSVKTFAELAFAYAGLDWKKYAVSDKQLYRASEVHLLKGDFSKAKKKLGWQSTVTFEELVKMMMESDLARLQRIKGV